MTRLKEREWFDHHPQYKSIPQLCGIDRLMDTMISLLAEKMIREIPILIRQMRERKTQVNDEGLLKTFPFNFCLTCDQHYLFSIFHFPFFKFITNLQKKLKKKNKRGNDLNTLAWKCCISLKPDSKNKGFDTLWEIRFLPFLSCFCHRKKATLYICHWNIGTEQNM